MINSKITFHGVTLRQTTGRIRLHYEGIRYLKDYYKEIGKKLCAMAHIDSVTFNSVTENLLVYYRHKDVYKRQNSEYPNTEIAVPYGTIPRRAVVSVFFILY